ncbi:hypothetical protein ACQZV8_17090, partial [Magnetococcales bacterium HHB-1]
ASNIDPSRLKIIAQGEDKPRATGNHPVDHLNNRRVEIIMHHNDSKKTTPAANIPLRRWDRDLTQKPFTPATPP